jgi:hypothetical protein
MTKFNHAYHNENDLVAFDDFADQIQGMPRAIIKPLYFNEQIINEDTGLSELKPSRFNAVLSEDETVQYNAVTKNYKLAQHSDVMYQVLNTIQATGIDGNARLKSFGSRAYMDMVFSNMQIADPTGTDISLGYTVRNSYDSTGAINLFPFAIRRICSNGQIMRLTPDLHLNVISIKHMGDIELKVREGMKTLIENTMRVQNVFVTMIDRANNNVIEFQGNELELTMAEYSGSRFSARKIIDSSKLPLSGEISQWQIVNAMTQYASWNASSGSSYERIETGAEKMFNLKPDELNSIKKAAIEAEEKRLAKQVLVTAPLTI